MQSSMSPAGIAILLPTLALAALTFVVWGLLLRARVTHIAKHRPTSGDFDTHQAAALYFQPVERPAHNLANLFEMPVLYFALVPLLLVADAVSSAQVVLAWSFVVLRVAHSAVHIGPNRIPVRARLFIVSSVVLLAMWSMFAFDVALSSFD